MKCGDNLQFYNFLQTVHDTILLDCRSAELYNVSRLSYPMLIHLPYDNLPETASVRKACPHHTTLAEDKQAEISSEESTELLDRNFQELSPYYRCLLKKRKSKKVFLINEGETVPDSVAVLGSLLLAEGLCLEVSHLANNFTNFTSHYPFLLDTSPQPVTSTESDMEMDELQIIKQKKLLIKVYPNVIIDKLLYLGTRAQACDYDMMHAMKITHILRCHDTIESELIKEGGYDIYTHYDDIVYLDVAVDDQIGKNIDPFLESCLTFFNQSMAQAESRVFVHCNMGISRSSTVIIWILMNHKKLSLREALSHTKACRSVCQPNYTFMKQLTARELALTAKTTVDLDAMCETNAYYRMARQAEERQKKKQCTVC